MLTAILNLVGFAIGLTAAIVSAVALTRWDGEKPCKPDDCKTCPFPPCKTEPKDDQ